MPLLARYRELLSILIPLGSMVWVLSIPQRLGVLVFPEQILAAMLGTALAVVYLGSAEKSPGQLGKQLAIGLSLLSLCAGIWLAWRIPLLSEEAFFRPIETLLLAVLVIPLVIDAMRRSVGASLVVVFFLFVLYALYGDLIPGKLQGRVSSPAELLRFLGTDTTAMLGLPLSVTCFVVVCLCFSAEFYKPPEVLRFSLA